MSIVVFLIGFVSGIVAAVAGVLFIQHQIEKITYTATAKEDAVQLAADLKLHSAAVQANTAAVVAATTATATTTPAK